MTWVSRIPLMRRLHGEVSGVAMVEFALSMPFLLFAGMWGVELANYSIVNMRISQLAQQIADNASRVGDESLLENRRLYEADLYDLLRGAHLQGGDSLGLYDNGRVIINSVEAFVAGDHCNIGTGVCVPHTGDGQFIHWQRCMGVKNVPPAYGVEADELPSGIGPVGREVEALPGTPVIYVEISYDYQPLISERFVGNPTISSYASYLVRDDRDLSEVYMRSLAPADSIADCATFDNAFD